MAEGPRGGGVGGGGAASQAGQAGATGTPSPVAGSGSGGGSGAGGSGGATHCPLPIVVGPGLSHSTIGPRDGVYDGPATVERSTERDLVLYFEMPAEAGGAGVVVRRTSITARHALPVLPPGAQLWLSKDPAGEATPAPFPAPPSAAHALSVRDQQGGKLLLGNSLNSLGAAAPISIGEVKDVCVEQNPHCLAEDAQRIHESIELLGDEPVTVASGESASVFIDGLEYEAQVWARRDTVGSGVCSPDYSPGQGYLSVELLAKEPELVTAGLELGVPPACSNGNDAWVDTSFALYGVSGGMGFVGKVVYSGPDFELRPGAFNFDVPGLADQGVGPRFLSLLTTQGTFVAPAPQQELWLDMPDLNVQALRESQLGAIVIATVHGMRAEPGSEPERAALIQQVLGFGVGSQRRCDYAELEEGPQALWDLVVDADSEVVAPSGSRTPFTLGGKSYEVWVDGYSSLSFSIYAAP